VVESAVQESVRLIIPVWGDLYASKLVSITLPAILAAGNLPALTALFDVELVIVTESRLFDAIRDSHSFQLAKRLCSPRLVALDDLMIDEPGDYGAVLTYALFRGFTDLGARMTETYLIFLNADFILCDGSLRHLGKLMSEGKRVIHAPSFRVNLEEVLPQLLELVDATTGTLSVPPRDMVRLALANKHRTVKARIVNQRICHQTWMDQYYWYVDEETLIGYQWPVALVAIKPQCVVTDPVLVWDYGFVPEAAPTADRHFIGDSDDFFMIELQSRDSGDAMIKVGWIPFDDIARNLSMWTTREHRESGKQLLKIHADDLPENVDEIIEESCAYMAEIYRRLSPDPVPHIGHSYLGPWFEGARQRMRGNQRRERMQADNESQSASITPVAASLPSEGLANKAIRVLESIGRKTFGSPPEVGKFHPLWVDTWPITSKITAWREAGEAKILWVSTGASLLYCLLSDRVEPAAFLAGKVRSSVLVKAPYDACICELTLDELPNLDRLYTALRPLMKDGADIVISVVKSDAVLDGAELFLESTAFPGIDISEIRFFGTALTGLFRTMYLRVSRGLQKHRIVRALTVSAVLILLAPLVWRANARAGRRDTAIFRSTWTSLMIEFVVKRSRPPKAAHSP
jgi:hypothetical protein